MSVRFASVIIFIILFTAIKCDYNSIHAVNPIHYNLSITTKMDRFQSNYTGLVQIDILPNEILRNLSINSKNLTINSVCLSTEKTPCRNIKFVVDLTKDLILITNIKFLQSVVSTIEIEFEGVLRTDGFGLYRYTSRDKKGRKRPLMATNFQPEYARSAFPCFDQIGVKSTFHLAITHHLIYTAVSNMPLETQERLSKNYVKTTFQKSPVMSIYALGFVVMFGIENISKIGVDSLPQLYNLYSESKRTEKGVLLVQNTPRILSTLESHFEIKYPLPKLGQIIVPGAKLPGLECFGLIIYRNDVVEFDSEFGSSSEIKEILQLAAHEIVHQFIGNLVTVSEWKYIWLSEGLAIHYENYALQEIGLLPRGHMVNEIIHRSFIEDNDKNSKPMTTERQTASQFLVSESSFIKAAGVIRMIEGVMSNEKFHAAMVHFLAKNSFKTVNIDDFKDALFKYCPEQKLLDLVDQWSTQSRYPLLTVTRNYTTGTVYLQQTRFRNRFQGDLDTNQTWLIPYNYATRSDYEFNDTSPIGWLENNKATLDLGLSPDDWIIFNKQQTGHYIVNYDKTNWELISKFLNLDNFTVIDPINRAQLLFSAFHLSYYSDLPQDVVLNLLNYLESEDEYLPWHVANSIIITCYGHEKFGSEPEPWLENLNNFTQRLTRNLYEKFNFVTVQKSSQWITRQLRNLAIKLACRTGNQKCKKDAATVYHKYMELKGRFITSDNIDPDVLRYAFCFGISSDDEFDNLWKQYGKLKNSGEQEIIMSSLYCHTEKKRFRDLVRCTAGDCQSIKNDKYREQLRRVLRDVEIEPSGGRKTKILQEIRKYSKHFDAEFTEKIVERHLIIKFMEDY